MWRHGDLFIMSADAIPEGLPVRSGNILLSKKATGHNHRISSAVIYEDQPTPSNNWRNGYFEVAGEPAKITHEEHKTIVLPPGKYVFHQQREYDEQEDRAVID